MLNRVIGIVGTSLALAMIAAPAFAQVGRISVPEPATISILAVGAGAAFVARKFLGRK